uniref:Uncharacterized protein n=1 Tax=Plectus sambesii TaxID=2011161 RepID=A0A914WF04_9BILA
MVGRIEADRVTRDVPNRRASPPSLGGADNIERRQVVGCKKERREKQQQSNSRSLKTAARCDEQQSERELRLNSPAATIHKDAEKMDALHRPSLPITPVPQSPARSTAKQSCLESTVFSLPDASDGSLDLDFIRQALRVGQDLSPKLSPVKPLTPRGLTPLRQALTPCAQASSSSNSVKERRTVTPLKISVVRPAMGGKARVSGKLAAMLLMKLEDEAKERSEGELSSDDEAADENDATTTRVDSCSPNVTQSAAADRKSIWMNSLRKNLQL